MSTAISSDRSVSFFPTNVMEQKDILLNVLFYLTENIKHFISLRLVNRTWAQVTDEPHLWQRICYQTGIVIPFNNQKCYEAYRYQKSALFLSQIKKCSQPQIEEFELEMAIDDESVQFVQDRYLIVKKESEITVIDFRQKKIVQTIQTKSTILSFCTSRDRIFISLASREIHSYLLIEPSESAILVLDGHKDDYFFDTTAKQSIQVLANDRWLISRSFRTIKQWDVMTGCCLSQAPTNSILLLKIDLNILYSTLLDLSSSRTTLVISDLTFCNLTIFKTVDIPTLFINNIENNYCSYISEASDINSNSLEDEENGLSDELSECDSPESVIHIFNLASHELITCPMQYQSLHLQPHLQTIQGIAIVSCDAYDPNKIYDDNMAIEDPDIITFIDIKTGKTLFESQKDNLYYFGNQWALTFFQGSLIYLSSNGNVIVHRFESTS